MPRILTSLTLLAAILPAPLFAQANCAARDAVVEKLRSGYGEVFAGGGLHSAKTILEVWYSVDKGTWTILMTNANGRSCIMASGTNWRDGSPDLQKPAGIPG